MPLAIQKTRHDLTLIHLAGRSGRHDLQQVGADPQVLPGDTADVLLGVGLTAHVPAVAAGVGDRPGDQQVWADGEPRPDRVLQHDFEEIPFPCQDRPRATRAVPAVRNGTENYTAR